MSSTHVLVVDSDRDRAISVADRARSKEWDVYIAIGADEALGRLRTEPITALLVDASVWIDEDLAASLAKQCPDLPVIVLARADEAPDELVEQLQLGAMTYVPRDADGRRLSETIQSIVHLSNRNPHRERVREFLRSGEIELEIANDPALIGLVVGYLQRILEDYGLTEQRERARVGLALAEALANAIIHGNLGISSALRNEAAEEFYREIETRRKTSPYRDRFVYLGMRFTQSSATFVIRDQGKGFDRTSLADPTDPENIMCITGRGILLMKSYCDAVSWNDKGNEVTLVKTLRG
jgi:anti-sigma regulatory factor (Ser/Thr protein kinase)/CheY-like chemotaxis protein